MKYDCGDLVCFAFTHRKKPTYHGIIVNYYSISGNLIYEVQSLNHSMNTYSISERCILKKI